MSARREDGRLKRRLAAAFLQACRAELAALKPGNVHVHADGHGMTVADFEMSARVAAPALVSTGPGVGKRILAAIRASRRVVDCNTNLGIVLLAAPLIEAASGRPIHLRSGLRKVLSGLTRIDALEAYEAIRLAGPGGLGRSSRHDVRKTPTVDLARAMAAAASRDRIAAQYATDFADVFEFGLPRLRAYRRAGLAQTAATEALFLAFLSCFPDSHIERKHGKDAAEEIRREAWKLRREAARVEPALRRKRLMAFDARLKADRLNPGTSADLTVACLLALRLDDIVRCVRRPAHSRERAALPLRICGAPSNWEKNHGQDRPDPRGRVTGRRRQ